MISKPFDQIEKSDIDTLVTESVAEGRTLDFKKLLPGNSDGDKKELLADVSSFANAAGGDLIFGVMDNNGTAGGAPGLSIPDADKEIQRLDASIRNGVEPRIPGIQIKTIDGFLNGSVLIVRIPQSWASPHMVTFKGTSRFFTRNSAGKHQMDVGEIRSAFAFSESIPKRIRDFRIDRLGKIIADETPVLLAPIPRIVLHLIPLSSMTTNLSLAPEQLAALKLKFPPIGGGMMNSRFNLEGFLTIGANSSNYSGSGGYCQIYRNGIVEAVDVFMLTPFNNHRTLCGYDLEREVTDAIGKYVDGLSELGISLPIVALLSLLGVKGYQITGPRRSPFERSHEIDRDQLIIPDLLMEDSSEELSATLRPIYDSIWNAGGWPGSPSYETEES